MQLTWTSVEEYFDDLFMEHDEILHEILKSSHNAELPPINLAPNQGKMLNFFVQMMGAKKILEIGTLGGYSAIWMGRALPDDGKLITLELVQRYADVAEANIHLAGLANKVQVVVGSASDTLPTLADEAPFDFIFIDADKPSNPLYFDWAMKYARVGTIIVLDNVVRDGEVTNSNSKDERVHGVQRVSQMIADEPRVEAFALQTVGSKGYDGFTMMRVVR